MSLLLRFLECTKAGPDREEAASSKPDANPSNTTNHVSNENDVIGLRRRCPKNISPVWSWGNIRHIHVIKNNNPGLQPLNFYSVICKILSFLRIRGKSCINRLEIRPKSAQIAGESTQILTLFCGRLPRTPPQREEV